MTTITMGSRPVTTTVQANTILTVTAAASSIGQLLRIGELKAGETRQTAIAAGETVTFGPFGTPRRVQLDIFSGASLSYDVAPADLVSQSQATAAGDARYAPILTNDVLDLVGAGAPVDYTDGTPPATGEGLAGPGSRYTDVTGKVLYLNTGTKAQPAWTALAFEA